MPPALREHGCMSNPVLDYDRVGSGEPLVLLHGFGSTRDDFAALIPDLARDFEVYSVDLPGHGNSPMIDDRPSVAALTDAVEADLDAHGLGRVHILGNSLGARGRHRTDLPAPRPVRGRDLPCGLGTPLERSHQGALMITARIQPGPLPLARRTVPDPRRPLGPAGRH